MKNLRRTIAAIAMTACLGAGAAAEELDWKQGRLGHLAHAIGTYRYDEVLADPEVMDALATLMPAEARAAMVQNLQVVGPIDFIAGHLVLSGNRPHHGDEDTAMVWIKVFDGTVRVILRQGGKATLYAREEQYWFLPLQLRSALAMPSVAVPSEAPPDVTWVR